MKHFISLPIAVIMIFLLLPLSLLAIKQISESELFLRISNPQLKGIVVEERKPDFSLKAWFNGDFQDDFSKWFNQNFVMRELLIRLNNQLYYSFFSKSYMYNESIIIGKNKQLYEKTYIYDYCNITNPLDDEKKDELVRKIIEAKTLLERKGVPFIILITPSKAYTYPEYIPRTFLKKKNSQSKNNYEQMQLLFKQNEVDYVDGQKVTLDLKRNIEYPLFPQGGTHWNHLAASYTLNKLIDKIDLLTSEVHAKVNIEKVETNIPPAGTDRDLLDLLNLWNPNDNYPAPKPVFTTLGGNNTDDIAVIGGSFCFTLLDIIREQKLFSDFNFLYYYKLGQYTLNDYMGKPYNVEKLDWENEIFNKKAIVLEINEQAFDGGHANAFLDDILVQLRYPGPLKTLCPGPLAPSAFQYEMQLINPVQTVMQGETIKISFKVKNTGKQTWPSMWQPDGNYRINLGYHCQLESGLKEGRIGDLPIDLRPGQEVTIEGTLGPFNERGRKTFIFDMVQENVLWFADHSGNKPISLTIDVK
ncbi:alginate O-acetyltransferase AlgX-related protein [Desulforamulus ruminis]|uniref:Galectin domain-containing protein n=1 Tax=Desulforamulus ruminis (strain ATCC 23193 / DSM 2154 / NCIMB 8452 / DL) TaxID=696281 RepID=F6DP35_DESRL|nr:hypothetical protein [Desulforamulus ruminis]AEG61864.1 hypothetical protein Desru_3662 [Desulforamulus ruminis DSM 2154]